MSDLGNGSRLENDTHLQWLILKHLEYTLDKEVSEQNRLISSQYARDEDMREIKDLASGMKQTIANLKQMTVNAHGALNAEIKHAQTNAQKVQAFTQELKDANLEVDGFLGETGSNFPSSEDLDTQAAPSTLTKADINGVSKNVDGTK